MDVPKSYSVKRTVPTYKPAKTPHVGKTADDYGTRVVIIREAERHIRNDSAYWIAPILEDGTLGAMTTTTLAYFDGGTYQR
ncbi:MAG TPA: hypothetical protein VH482_05475 [Thermomicrobiales bacterium]|jgi:hypothetical protein